MILKIYTKIKNKWCLSKIVYSEVFNVEKSFTDDKIEVIHFVDGFMYAEKVKIYPWFNVAKIWEKSH